MRKQKYGIICVLLAIVLAAAAVMTGCGSGTDEADKDAQQAAETTETTAAAEAAGTVVFTDDCGRDVEIPKTITKAAPSGAVAQMVLMTIAPDALAGLSAEPMEEQVKYFPEYTRKLPVFGQFYGSKANLNMEALIAAQPQVIVDIGDKKETHKEDMDKIQEQTGIPTIFVETTLDKMPGAYRTLGKLFGKEEKGNELAEYIEKTVAFAKEKAEAIPEEKRQSVYYGTGATGLDCNADGSIQADVIDIVGAKNAVVGVEVSDKGGGTLVNMEQLYNFDPDNIIVTNEGSYGSIDGGDESWADLTAVKNGKYYEIPGVPYNWMSGPPSVNRILGIWWLGNLVYPEQYDFDMVEKAQEYYKLFFDYDLSEDEAKELLANSSLKNK